LNIFHDRNAIHFSGDSRIPIMSSSLTPLRLVLDTNVWLDWMVFDDVCVVPIRGAVGVGAAQIFIDRHCEHELERVLAYRLGRRILTADTQSACLAALRDLASRVDEIPKSTVILPKCSDPDDQKFLELARDCCAHFLITKDKALLDLARRQSLAALFRIATPWQFGGLFPEYRQ
jgi:uncharacterized protein